MQRPRNPIEYYYILINVFVYAGFFVASLVYLFRIICRLSRKGTSRTLYRRVCMRYVLFIVFLLPFYVDRFTLTYLSLYAEDWKEEPLGLDLVLFLFPILQTMTRICEPFVLITFWSILQKYWQKCHAVVTNKKIPKKKDARGQLNAVLSEVNIENDDFNYENENMSRKARGSVNSSQILDRNGKSN